MSTEHAMSQASHPGQQPGQRDQHGLSEKGLKAGSVA